jgi:leukotriene-A4 hydrolase
MKSTLVTAFTLLASVAFAQTMDKNDIHSFAKPHEARVKHLDLQIEADFEGRRLTGTATYALEKAKDADRIVFDTDGLEILQITLDKETAPARYTLGERTAHLGQPLTVFLGTGTASVSIRYRTGKDAAALQWLSPEQTAGKRHPFLFTQSQAILARSWIPCQDSPGIRFTYNAEVKVPAGLLALMSAENPQERQADGKYSFRQSKPIPAYLMALAAGNIAFRPVGKRTGVYAEPEVLDKAHYEFAEMESMLEAAEKLYGTYPWGRYDLIVLPPSFPFGGMENPCLTFATPTVIAGDRSLTSLVAHELAHSWSGNLVTNATWNDFWLNEGFTVYFERRIMEALYGKSYADMLGLLGYRDLLHSISEYGKDNPDTRLKLDLAGRSPDDGVSDIAYEKGYFLLRLIEESTGREKFDAFLRGYFNGKAFQSTNTEEFLAYLKKELFRGDTEAYNRLLIDKWVYEPGLPSNCPVIRSERFAAAEKAAGAEISETALRKLNTSSWSSHEWLHYVKSLPSSLTAVQMGVLDRTFHFTSSGNNEILAAWLLLAVEKEYQPAYEALENFLVNIGRRKYLTPLYKALLKTEQGKAFAGRVYAKARPNYHFVTTSTMDELLGWKKS